MPDTKYTKLVVLVILSGLVAYRLLRTKKVRKALATSTGRLALVNPSKTLRLKIPSNEKK